MRSQVLNTCKKIGYEYFCEELFVVKSKHKFSCASAVYFNLNMEIKQNCNFGYHFNKTDITPLVLDGGQQIILANWPSYRRYICTYNNYIPISIPSHLYVLLNRNILCNCDIEAEDNFLLESLAACGENNNYKLEMFFIVNLAFLDHLEDLTEVLDTPIDRNWTHERQTLPISLESFQIKSSLLQASKTLKDYIKQFQEHNKKLNLQKQNDNTKSEFKSFVSSFIADIIGFSAALLTVIIMLVIIYIVTGHSKPKMLVANMALQHIKTVEAAALNPNYAICENGLVRILMIINLGIVTLMALAKLRKSRVSRGRLFFNTIKIKLFVADNQCYIPLHLNKIAGSVHLLKLHGMLTKENLTLKKNWIWDVLEIDWTDGTYQTYTLLKRLYYWKGLKASVEKHIKMCYQCQRRNNQVVKYATLHIDVATFPMQFISMDLIGEFHPPTSRNHRYALTVICMLTVYVFCVPLKTKAAEEVIQAYIDNVYSKFKGSLKMLSDNGTEFKNKMFEQIAEELGLEYKLYTPPYHPASNGRIEGFHAFLKACVAKHVAPQLEWDVLLPLACAAYNFIPNEHSKESPFFLMFGRDPVLPLNTLLGPKMRYLGNDINILSLETMKNMFEIAATNLKIAQEKGDPENNPLPTKLQPRDTVLVQNHTRGPFDPKYVGDYQEVSLRGNQVEVRPSIRGHTEMKHVKHIKYIVPAD